MVRLVIKACQDGVRIASKPWLGTRGVKGLTRRRNDAQGREPREGGVVSEGGANSGLAGSHRGRALARRAHRGRGLVPQALRLGTSTKGTASSYTLLGLEWRPSFIPMAHMRAVSGRVASSWAARIVQLVCSACVCSASVLHETLSPTAAHPESPAKNLPLLPLPTHSLPSLALVRRAPPRAAFPSPAAHAACHPLPRPRLPPPQWPPHLLTSPPTAQYLCHPSLAPAPHMFPPAACRASASPASARTRYPSRRPGHPTAPALHFPATPHPHPRPPCARPVPPGPLPHLLRLVPAVGDALRLLQATLLLQGVLAGLHQLGPGQRARLPGPALPLHGVQGKGLREWGVALV